MLGFFSPLAIIFGPAQNHPVAATVAFVDMEPIEVPLSGAGHHALLLQVKLETTDAAAEKLAHLTPRIRDSFNRFLTEVSPTAFDKRGVLEIIRAELVVRAHEVAAGTPVNDVLITEFRLK